MQSVSVNYELIQPTKIVCVGRNYAAHIEELGNKVPESMVVFNKPNSAITHILHSQIDGHVLHYESELAFTVASGKLAAVGFGLDLTKRALQSRLKEKGLPWERAKAFDGAALFSKFVALPSEIEHLSLQLDVDGEQRQAGGLQLQLHRPEFILKEIASFTTLEDGDIIMSGTPSGVGEVQPGQTFKGQVLLGDRQLVSAAWIAQ
ncbi:MAG: fumarylacetoacetate hydrolase family protein [Halioglobus sp.]|nr:fumarylacetoacetate hydrolase family protein [Halioglobus sp.]